MFSACLKGTRAFGRDQRGAVAIVYGLTVFITILAVGLVIDVGRTYHVNQKLGMAMDAAALAAARGMRTDGLNDTEIQAVARKFFEENIKGGASTYAQITSFGVSIDRNTNAVSIDLEADVPTLFARVAGFDKISFPKKAVAIFNTQDIELSLSLDVTGSMCNPCTKIADLKSAVTDLIGIMLPDDGTPNKVRIGFAPFAAGINAGPYANAISAGRSVDNCVYERESGAEATDAAPTNGSAFKVAGDDDVTTSLNRCPRAELLALTDDKSTLIATINGYSTGGSTAGHLGTAFAWYLLSPAWSTIWPTSAKPAAYDDGKTIKAVILMTDGKYNTYGGRYGSTLGTRSADEAKANCAAMKAKKIRVYTIGFQLPAGNAEDIMRTCASGSTSFFRAEDGEQLRAAFRAIAVELNNLRLSK
ncbi:MAG: pilus assembly protein TadG-related protein [Pseudomonadota bacterium]